MAMWMMSNRQPWTYAVCTGLISTKTRNKLTMQAGDIVWLHASTAPWQGWKRLAWMDNIDIKLLATGGICGVGLVEAVGKTEFVMPLDDWQYFNVEATSDQPAYNCAMPQSVNFSRVIQLPFVRCPGRQNPVKKLPDELVRAIASVPDYRFALNQLVKLGGTT